jgi:hypothetical protein
MNTELRNYYSLVYEIHLAVSSGDDTARIGVSGMITRKEELAKKLGLEQHEERIFDFATRNSSYRRS